MTAEPTEADFHRLHPATFLIVFTGIVRRFLIPGLLVFFFGGFPGESLLMVLAIPAFMWAGFKYWILKIAITSDQLILREGLTARSLRRIPLAKIRSIETRRGLAHRLFNVDDVIVHTGAGSDAEATLSALGAEAVTRLKAHIAKARRDRPRVQGQQMRTSVWRCAPTDLVGYGMIYNRGWLVLFVLLGVLWQADLFTYGRVEDFILDMSSLFGSSPLAVVFAVGVFLVMAWLVLRIFSVLWSLVTYYGFWLENEDDRVHLRFGLLFHRNLTLPERRFHIIQIEERPLHRWTGHVTLSAWTAGTWGGDDEDDEGDAEWNAYFNSLVLHPFAEKQRARELIAEVTDEPDWDRLDWQGLDPRAFGRICFRGLFGLPICASLSYFHFPWGLVSWALLVAGFVWYAWVTAYHTQYAVSSHGLWLRSGYFRKRWRMIGHGHIQSVETVASPLDLRRNLAKLRVDAASAPAGFHAISIPFLPQSRAEQTRRHLAEIAEKHALVW